MQAHEQTQFLQAVGMFVRDQVKQAVEIATQPLMYRINQLEMMLQENIKGAVSQLAEFEEKIAAIPAGKDGRDGNDGAPGKDGVDGLPGNDGVDGQPGKDGNDAPSEEFIREYITGAVEASLAAWHRPQDGKDGRDGINGKDGKNGTDGLNVDLESLHAVVKDCVDTAVSELPVPAAPVGVVGGYIDRDGDLYLSLSDGQRQKMGRVVGRDGKDVDTDVINESLTNRFRLEVAKIPLPKDGKDGKDGRDGFGFDDLVLEHDGTDFYLVFKRQDEVKRFLLPVTRHIGVWREGNYKIGSQVTYDGSQFIAITDTSAKPANSTDWQMCVRKGRDGKQGERGLPGKDGKPGRDGRDLTQLAFDGSKS